MTPKGAVAEISLFRDERLESTLMDMVKSGGEPNSDVDKILSLLTYLSLKMAKAARVNVKAQKV